MKHELDRMMSIIKDYETGYGGITDSFLRKELEMFAKDYHKEQCNIADVSNLLCDSFDPDNSTSSATRCKCGREKWEHPKAT